MNHIGPELHDDRPRVVAFGGGKGGTGRTTLCADIARALARYNFRVLCLDASWHCPTLNILLNCEEPRFDLSAKRPLGEPGSHIAEFIVPSGHPSIFLASLAAARRHPFTPPTLHADELLHDLHDLAFDWILIDLPAGISPLDVGLFTLADIPILITSPEPAAVRVTTQFLRAALFRAIAYHPDAADVEREVIEILAKQPLRMNTRELRYDAPSVTSRTIIDETITRFETYMIVNLVREGAEHDLGFVLSHALSIELQLFPRVLTSIDFADRRWFYNRRTTGMEAGRSEDGLSNDIELLARNIRDIGLVDARYPRPIPTRGQAPPALRMGLNPELSRNEVRQYCRRLWEGYRREAAISLVFDDPLRRLETADELELLYRQVLTMPSESFSRSDVEEASRRHQRPGGSGDKGPERSVERPSEKPGAPLVPRRETQPPRDQQAPREDDDKPTSSQATQPKRSRSPGDVLAKLRREHALSLQELSSRTHIGVKYLAAIEDVDLEVLPRSVYLRGYLREIARVFAVDPAQLVDDYFRYLDDA